MSQSGKSRSIKSASSRVRSAIDRAGLIQQREQLRQTMMHKFNQDYAKGNAKLSEIITDLVNNFFQNEKISEETLRGLRQRVVEACGNKQGGLRRPKTGVSQPSQVSKHVTVREDDVSDRQSVAASMKSQKSYAKDDNRSITSSQQQGPKSVYVPDEEDEWTALVKFDTEMYKKEQELEAQRQREFKRKMREELDRQLDEKRRRKVEEQIEENAYVRLNEHQMAVYDQREQDKKRTLLQKQRLEKAQRDKQVHDEERRKAQERRKERELDNILVRRINEELTQEQREQLERKTKEKERLQMMIAENEYNKKRVEAETQLEKRQEVEMQEKYTRLLDNMERQRELDRIEREEKIKRIMSSFAQTVVQDQKNMIKDEDDKMLKAIIAQGDVEQTEEDRRKEAVRLQKLEMRQFLNSQIDEKRRRKEEETELDKRQAQVWHSDLENYTHHEYQKTSYIKNVNKRHQDILKQQMDERQSKSRGKQQRMTTQELQHNKPLFKEMASTQNQIKIKKVTIGEDL